MANTGAATDLRHERGRGPGPPSLVRGLEEPFGVSQRVGDRHVRASLDRGILTDGGDALSVGGTGSTEHAHTEVEDPSHRVS